MTALKCLFTGQIKKHVELREDEPGTSTELRPTLMKYAGNKRIDRERGGQPMDVDAATDERRGKITHPRQ